MAGGPRNLFHHLRNIPPDEYAVLTSYRNFAASELDPASWLPARYVFYDYTAEADRSASRLYVDPSRVRYRLMDVMVWRLHRLGAITKLTPLSKLAAVLELPLSGIRVALAGMRFARAHRFRALLVISDSGLAMTGGWLLSLLLRKRLVLFFFDLYADNHFKRLYKMWARLAEPLIVSRAAAVIVTNEETRDFLVAKFAKLRSRVAIVRNSTDAPLRDLARAPYQPTRPYTIVFAGHVYWAQEESVQNLVEAMRFLADAPIKLRLLVLRPPQTLIAAIAGRSNIELGNAPRRELPGILQSAGLLFLPFGWNTPAPDIVRTASPAKLAEYLAAGVPILVHAPDYALVSNYVKRHRCGFVVSENSPLALAEAIRGFFAGRIAEGAVYAANAVRMAREEFDPGRNAAAFWKSLCAAAEN